MTPGKARELLQRLSDRGETARLGWAEARVAVAGSRGLRRSAEVTSAWASVIAGGAGKGTGAGMASAARPAPWRGSTVPSCWREPASGKASKLPPPAEGPPAGPVPVVLSQEAAAALLEMLNRRAFTSTSFHHGSPFLRDSIGTPVFHAAVSLRDDATDPRGIPFPFDLLGSAKRPLDLIERGVFLTPALDERLAIDLGRRPTPHLVATDEAAPSHLFLLPGERPDAELLSDADGGLWIGALDPVQATTRAASASGHRPGSPPDRGRSARRAASRPALGGRSPVSPLPERSRSEASR